MLHLRNSVRRSACWICVAAAGLFLSLSGCTPPSGEVSGRFTYQGKPVVQGEVAVITDDGRVATGPCRDGSYTVIAPAGRCKIAVSGSDPAQAPKVSAQEFAAKKKEEDDKKAKGIMPQKGKSVEEIYTNPTAVASQYSNFETSGLSLVVKPGKQTYNIDLEPAAEQTEKKKD